MDIISILVEELGVLIFDSYFIYFNCAYWYDLFKESIKVIEPLSDDMVRDPMMDMCQNISQVDFS